MKKIMHIEGMMCGHCEAAVKKALEALPQVDEAVVSHEAGTAELTLNAEIADDVLKKTVEVLSSRLSISATKATSSRNPPSVGASFCSAQLSS